MMNNFLERLEQIVGKDHVQTNELMSKHTTFRIGGEADYYVTPTTKEQVADIISLCKEKEVSYYIIGNGSNLLVGDHGYRGVIIQIGNFLSECTFKEVGDKVHVRAGAGILLSRLATAIAGQELTGFEFAGGIPGTLGGAITMNAGAYGGEINQCCISALVLTKEGEFKEVSRDELAFGYRTSAVQTEGYIVFEVTLELEKGNKEEILSYMADLAKRRKDKQPLEYPSAGSTFKRPTGFYAGKLIEDSKLKGFRIGNVMVSEKHSGFVINTGGGTAKEVLAVIDEVSRVVYEQFGVRLEPEVRLIGEFNK